jgi:phosphoglycerate dehydrogenase-like enzyme
MAPVFLPPWLEEDIVAHAADADAVIVGPTEPYTKKASQALTKCRIISRIAIG